MVLNKNFVAENSNNTHRLLTTAQEGVTIETIVYDDCPDKITVGFESWIAKTVFALSESEAHSLIEALQAAISEIERQK